MSEYEPPNGLSSQTTPTWEVELLISGVAVFAMLQLPGWLDDRMFALTPRLDASWSKLVELLYFYSKTATVILAATFVIHLLLRARWIALVGVYSVYPDGVRWDKLRMGPLQREIERQFEVPTEVVIERADNLATTVFAVGVMLALVLVVLTGVVAVVMGTSTTIAAALDWQDGPLLLLVLVFSLVMLPFALAVTLDRRHGARWKPGSRMHRLVHGTLLLYSRAGMRPGNNRIRALLASNGGDRRFGALIMAIITITIGIVMFAYWGMRNGTRFGIYDSFPAGAAGAVDAAHYDDQRNPARDPAVPFVQAMVIEDPYLRLVLPYSPRQDGPALRAHCTINDAPRDEALLSCLQGLHPVQLDGTTVRGLRYDVASDPRTDRPALLAMIDIRSLAAGRHEVRIGRAPSVAAPARQEGDGAESGPPDHVIAFWK